MAYNKDEIVEKLIGVIETMPIRKASELLPYFIDLGISERTFYEWELHQSQQILSKIEHERLRRWTKRMKRWETSGNPALEIAAAKLEANQEDLEVLTTSKIKQDLKVELPKVNFSLTTNGKEHTSL